MAPNWNSTIYEGMVRFDAFAHQDWDADKVLEGNIDMTLYRQLYPYPYLHYMPAVHNMIYRTVVLAPAHYFFYTAVFTIMFALVKYINHNIIFKPIARLLKLSPDDYVVFAESGHQFSYYLFAWIANAWFLMRETWFFEPLYVYEGNFPNQPMEIHYYWMMVVFSGWYTWGLISHVFLEPRKKDFMEMLIHHLATLTLIYLSYVKGYYRFMALATYCHDVCDIFLHHAKMWKCWDNIRAKNTSSIETIVFVPLPVFWVAFRLVLLPYLVILPCVWQGPQIIGIDNVLNYWIFTPCLVALYALHWFWFYLIMRIAYRRLSGGSLHDIREGHDRTLRLQKPAAGHSDTQVTAALTTHTKQHIKIFGQARNL
eukprot:TRINITY_DN4387_c0_g1_i4.p1 TRINITY_DN4387_c0_g1~~TRINITY_DN4387_c0_g1_i4.p1  ORF type:complete len:369 (-),score=26.51 TRINITY_DN4387_c0_g1_i4:36-1142(-)